MWSICSRVVCLGTLVLQVLFVGLATLAVWVMYGLRRIVGVLQKAAGARNRNPKTFTKNASYCNDVAKRYSSA